MSATPGEFVTAWEDIARLCAEVAGAVLYVGVRPNGTWFAHCNSIEVDAEGAAQAVYAVVEEAQRRAVARVHQAAVEAKAAEDYAAGMTDTAALINASGEDDRG